MAQITIGGTAYTIIDESDTELLCGTCRQFTLEGGPGLLFAIRKPDNSFVGPGPRRVPLKEAITREAMAE